MGRGSVSSTPASTSPEKTLISSLESSPLGIPGRNVCSINIFCFNEIAWTKQNFKYTDDRWMKIGKGKVNEWEWYTGYVRCNLCTCYITYVKEKIVKGILDAISRIATTV
jgi:hypothetical protein